MNFLWGNSVALSWMWGLGLFFSVQFSLQYGLFGLLTFAIPNALGLMIFGGLTQVIARRAGNGPDALGAFFANWSRPYRLIFFLYQILAITLTIFALVRYAWQPLGLEPAGLYLLLTVLIILAAATLFGEEFDIRRIKYSHGVLGMIALGAMLILFWQLRKIGSSRPMITGSNPFFGMNFWGYAIPICVGLTLGPWLDLQQWQRAIQIQREGKSPALSYLFGGGLFFLLLLAHGGLALWVAGQTGGPLMREGIDGLAYGEDAVTRYLWGVASIHPLAFASYTVILCIMALTTLDSGYIALRWYLSKSGGAGRPFPMTLLPEAILGSPLPALVFTGLFTLLAVVLRLELEYFMIFYATFFVGYAGLALLRAFHTGQGNALPQVKMFCVGSVAVVIFAYGYFLANPLGMILGSILPVGYVGWLLWKPGSAQEFVRGVEELEDSAGGPSGELVVGEEKIEPGRVVPFPTAGTGDGHDPFGHFEGKWFVHSFVATYADTNSVGNVYFGMYAMWVGKTRELFFNRCLPKFNLKTTPYYILTRSFEHKFMRETREFERVSVKIKVGEYNRKFVTLEHQIYDSEGNQLGKGKQQLIFVSSGDYKLLDIPDEVYEAFVAYA
jgi:acyl-CoA thioesterase FadM